MSEAGDAWDVPAIERTLQQLLAHPEAAARITEGEPALESVRRQVLWEWQRRLIVERNANSEAAETPSEEPFGRPEQRFAREASIFDSALADVLPLGALLNQIEARLGRTLQTAPELSKDPIEAGLQALAAADLEGALYVWSSSGDVAAVAAEIRSRREPFAQQLLQQAASHVAQAATLAGDAERAELRAVLRADYLDPARRVGTELQRDRAGQLSTALDLLLAPGAAAPATQPRRAPATPVAPTRTPPQTTPLSRSPRRVPLIIALAALGIVLLALIIWTLPGAMRRTGGVASPSTFVVSTPRTLAVVGETVVPVATPSAEPTQLPTAPARPTATTRPTTPATSTPAPRIEAIEPAELFVGALPAELRLRGADLERVAAAQLLAPDKQPIPLVLVESRAGELLLRLDSLPEPVVGAVEVALVLDGVGAEIPSIVLRDFKEVRTIAGVRQEYSYTGRILSDGGGPFATMLDSAGTSGAMVAPLRNGEQVELLQDDVEGWYRVRIRVANDPAQTGKSGWIERWLVDAAGVPDEPEPTAIPTPRATATPRPSPTPQPSATPAQRPQPTASPAPTAPPLRSFVAEVIVSYPGSGSSGGKSSCVQGVVRDRAGSGVAAAAIAANNGNAEVGTLTNGAGVYQICGLGDSTWSILLRFVPGDPPLAQEAVATVYVNGSREQAAVVNFVER